MRRIDWTHGVAPRAASTATPPQSPRPALGPLLRDRTRDAIRTAGSRRDGLTLAVHLPRVPEALMRMNLSRRQRPAWASPPPGPWAAPASRVADAPTERLVIVVLLRGALDGLAAVVPYGDPALASACARASSRPSPGQPENGLLDLGGFYGLNPALAGLHGLYQAGELLPVHAVAGPYRSRSHFDAQDYLESGGEQRMTSGWLNRAVAALPGRRSNDALAIGLSVPLMLRGPAQVGTYAPTGFPALAPDLYARIADLAHEDPLIGPVVLEGLKDRGFSAGVLAGMSQTGDRNAVAALAGAAGRMLAAPNGPRVAALEGGGWDTHASQMQRLTFPLSQLDAGMVALKQALGPVWDQTAVLILTEFGRTARVNGTNGTDHGTAGVAFVAGGAIAGGRVAGTWPGLAEGKLFENRDLAPTMDLRAVAMGLLTEHMGLPNPPSPPSSPAAPASRCKTALSAHRDRPPSLRISGL